MNFKWLEESINLKQPAAEECFLIETEETASKIPEPPSPLSKKVKKISISLLIFKLKNNFIPDLTKLFF